MNAEHERALALRELTELPIEVPWRAYGIFVQIVFFVLTCAGLIALYELSDSSGILTGVLALVLAEWLIGARRWYRTGVESALWIGGLLACITELPRTGKPEALLIVAAAFAIAGARVRNALFGAIAAGFVMHYTEAKWDAGVLAALIMATIALVALCRTWQRPSTEWLWSAITVLLPIAGYAEADAPWRTTTITLYALFGTIAFIAAIPKRHHAMFFATMSGFAIAAIELAREIPIALEAKLAIGGALLLTISLLVSRRLRDRKTGFVTTEEKLPAIDIAVTLAIAPQTPEVAAGPERGGNFGGAGASGSF